MISFMAILRKRGFSLTKSPDRKEILDILGDITTPELAISFAMMWPDMRQYVISHIGCEAHAVEWMEYVGKDHHEFLPLITSESAAMYWAACCVEERAMVKHLVQSPNNRVIWLNKWPTDVFE